MLINARQFNNVDMMPVVAMYYFWHSTGLTLPYPCHED